VLTELPDCVAAPLGVKAKVMNRRWR
jgi:hypothetical protein